MTSTPRGSQTEEGLSQRTTSSIEGLWGVRYQVKDGPGGRQIQIADPDGNPIELFEPADR